MFLKSFSKIPGLIFLLAIVIGIIWHDLAVLNKLILPALTLIIFWSVLDLDLKATFREMFSGYLWLSLFLKMLLIPVVLYLLLKNLLLENELIAILLLLAVPSGVSTPAFALLWKADRKFSLNFTVLSSILCPLTIPLILLCTIGTRIQISILDLGLTLVLVIGGAFLLSYLVQKYAKQVSAKLLACRELMVKTLIFLVVAVAVAMADLKLTQNISGLTRALVLTSSVFVFNHLWSYLLGFRQKRELRMSTMISVSYMNNALAISLATVYFPTTLFLVAVSEVPWAVSFALMSWLNEWYVNRNS